MASEQAEENLLDKILSSNQKLRECYSDWNKLLESDDEEDEELDSSLADDFSSSLALRSSDFSDDLMDTAVTGSLDVVPEKVASSSKEVVTDLLQDEGQEAHSDSGLDVCSSSSRLNETPLTSTFATTSSPDASAQVNVEEGANYNATNSRSVSNVVYYSNREQSVQNDPFAEPAVPSNKRNYDAFKAPTPTKAVSQRSQLKDDVIFRKPTTSPSLSRSSSRTSIRSTSTTSEPPHKRRNATRAPIEYETDQQVILRRQKQIDYGKNTIGYQAYLTKVPKNRRSKENPVTPDKFVKFSRRSWDQQVKIWRKKIHEYDPPEIIHYQSNREDQLASSHIREVKKHLNFDQLASSTKGNAPSKGHVNGTAATAEDEIPFDEIDASDILNVEDFAL